MPIILTVMLLLGQLAPTDAAADARSVAALSASDRTAILQAAGATMVAPGTWRMCRDDDEPATIESARDLNGDGRPEALVTEGGTACYGNTSAAYALMSKQASGSWRLLDQETGIAQFLVTKGVGGYPDIEVGGPGFCFPKERWNGSAYKVVGSSYDGKPCKAN